MPAVRVPAARGRADRPRRGLDRPVGLALTGAVAALVVVLLAPSLDLAHPRASLGSSGQVERLLATRAAALLTHDARQLAGTTAVDAAPAVADLAARTRSLPLRDWSYAVTAVRPGPGAGQIDVQALLRYRIAPDAVDATARRHLVVDLAPDGAPARVRSDWPVGAALPWDLAAVTAASAVPATVLLVGPAAGAGEWAALLSDAARAAQRAEAVWGPGRYGSPVVVAVRGPAELALLAGRDRSGVAGLVALATPDRVYVDLSAYDALPAAGRTVLLTHEVTHLLTGAAADDRAPLWLEEGFADLVGFSGSGIPVGTAAAALLDDVRRHGPPAALPSDADFAPEAGATRQAEAYAGAWLLCRLVAQRAGTARLVAVYRATSRGHDRPLQDLDRALRRQTGRSLGAWVAAWRTELARLAG